MRSVLCLAIKDLRLLSRDWMALFFIIFFPIVMGVFFGLVGASMAGGETSGGEAMKIGVYDEDDSEISRRFIESFESSGSITVHKIAKDQASDLVRKGKLLAFIGIPPGFGETAGMFWTDTPAIQLGVDPSRGAEAGMLQGLIMQAMGTLIMERFKNPAGMRAQLRGTMDKIDSNEDIPAGQRALLRGFMGTLDSFMANLGRFNDDMSAEGGDSRPAMEFARIETVDVTRRADGPHALTSKLKSQWDISFPAAIMWGVMGCVAGFAVSIVRERTQGTMLRLQVAPISRTQVLAGKGLACFLSVIGVVAFMMTLGGVLGIQLARPDMLVFATLCVAVCFVGMMMLISLIGKSEEAVAGAGWGLIVLLCMFGGGMMPLAFMPPFMQTMSHFSPVKWGILALEGAVWRDFSFAEMLLPCGVLLGIGAAAFSTAAVVFKRQQA